MSVQKMCEDCCMEYDESEMSEEEGLCKVCYEEKKRVENDVTLRMLTHYQKKNFDQNELLMDSYKLFKTLKESFSEKDNSDAIGAIDELLEKLNKEIIWC